MRKVRDCFTILVIAYMTGINFSPSAARSLASIEVVEGDSRAQAVKSAIYVIAFFFLIWNWRRAPRLSTKNIPLLMILVWVFVSATWSAAPAVTLRRSVGLLGTTLIGLYLASRYDHQRLGFLSAWSFVIVDVLSLLLVALFPAQGISWDPYGWQGIYFTKNGLGANAVFGMILFVALVSNRKTRTLGIIGFILSATLLIGSRSATSMIVLAIALSLWGVLLLLLGRGTRASVTLLPWLLILLLVGIWLYSTNGIQIMLGFFGKDPSLTGRVPVWENVMLTIKHRPWLGYGYGAVWLGTDYGIGSYISYPLNYYAVNAHNGYLDVILEIGIVGLILVSSAMVGVIFAALDNIRRLARVSGSELWPVVFLMALIIYNSTEAMLLVQNSIAWIFVAFMGFARARTSASSLGVRAEKYPQRYPRLRA